MPLQEGGRYEFGPFELDTRRRTLLCNGIAVSLTARLFDTLLCLVQHPDRLVERQELEHAVWPGRCVQNGNLQKAISSLRKALHDAGSAKHYIVTIPGRGFQFSVPVRFESYEAERAGDLPPEFARTTIALHRPGFWASRTAHALATWVAVALALGGSAATSWLAPQISSRAVIFAPPPHSIAVAQTDIAKTVAESLNVAFRQTESNKLGDGYTHSEAAFDAYLRGAANNQEFDPASARQAVANFSQAIALDPNYAQAFAGRALAHNFLARAEASHDKLENRAAENDADQAIHLSPLLAEAHRAKALVMLNALNFKGAAREIELACAQAPDDNLAQETRGKIEGELGHHEIAIDSARRAVALDPLNPAAYRRLGLALYQTRRFDEALATYRHAAAVDKHPSRLTVALSSSAYLAKHDPAAAERICADGNSWSDHVCLAIAYHALGRQAEAASHFATLYAALGDSAAFLYAEIYAQWGQPNEALNWLQTAWMLKDNGLSDLKVTPFLDPIRGAARFKDIEHQVNFPS